MRRTPILYSYRMVIADGSLLVNVVSEASDELDELLVERFRAWLQLARDERASMAREGLSGMGPASRLDVQVQA